MTASNVLPLSAARRYNVVEGRRSKCAFLLHSLSREDATPAERSIALIALLAEADTFVPVLTNDEAASVATVVSTALSTSAYSTPGGSSITPNDLDATLGPVTIEGTSVPCVVVAGGETVDVGRVSLPAGRYGVTIEALVDPGAAGSCQLLVDDHPVDSVPLTSAPTAAPEFSLELSGPTDVSIRVSNDSRADSSVRWLRADVIQLSDPEIVSSSVAALELAGLRSDDPTSVFCPPTGEPMRMADVEKLMSLHGRFAGERIFVMGNGPSLNTTPLHLLNDDYVFAVNRISLLFDRIDWRPTFFTAFDVRVVPDNAQEFADLDLEYKFFSSRYKQLLGDRPNHFFHHTKGFYEGFGAGFEPTVPYSGFGGGGTIGIMAIQLAWFMGFREIYLIGTDVSYSVPKTAVQSGADAFGDGTKLELTSTEDDDANHFDPRYFGKGKKWHNPNVRDMKIGFGRAARYIDARGGALRNATVGGELESVERVDFESLF